MSFSNDLNQHFENLSRSFVDLPPAWYPELLRRLVGEAYKNNAFPRPSGASEFVKQIEPDILKLKRQ